MFIIYNTELSGAKKAESLEAAAEQVQTANAPRSILSLNPIDANPKPASDTDAHAVVNDASKDAHVVTDFTSPHMAAASLSIANVTPTSASSIALRLCDNVTCGRMETLEERFKSCARCRRLFYCSVEVKN